MANAASNKIEISYSKALDEVSDILSANLVPFLVSSPGQGKSSLGAQVAKELQLDFIDERLTTYDVTDMNGYPMVNQDTKRAFFAPHDVFPLYKPTGDAEKDRETLIQMLPKGKKGWLLFLDEFPQADPAVQAAAYKLILDRQVGQWRLHPRVKIMLAGNDITHGAYAHKSNTAIQSRVITLNLRTQTSELINHLIDTNAHRAVISFVEHEGDNVVHGFNAKHTEDTFSCARTLEFLSRICIAKEARGKQLTTPDAMATFAGTIGAGKARAFQAFCRVYNTLISFDEVVADPLGVRIPNDRPDALCALTGILGERTDLTNLNQVMQFVRRLPMVHQVNAVRKLVKNSCVEINESHPIIDKWVDEVSVKKAQSN